MQPERAGPMPKRRMRRRFAQMLRQRSGDRARGACWRCAGDRHESSERENEKTPATGKLRPGVRKRTRRSRGLPCAAKASDKFQSAPRSAPLRRYFSLRILQRLPAKSEKCHESDLNPAPDRARNADRLNVASGHFGYDRRWGFDPGPHAKQPGGSVIGPKRNLIGAMARGLASEASRPGGHPLSFSPATAGNDAPDRHPIHPRKKRARRVPLHGGHCFLCYPKSSAKRKKEDQTNRASVPQLE
jgi:hypothetical protein